MTTFADRYDAVMVPVIFRPWAMELIARAPPWDGAKILDLACGTGAVTRTIVDSGIVPGSLTGVDMSDGMLSVASKAAQDRGIEANWIQADAGALPFGEGQFDLAYCQQALQFFPDRAGALRELHRCLAPGGRVAFCVSTGLEENPLLRAQAAALEVHVGAAAAEAVRAICSLTDPGTLRQLFDDAGFADVQVEKVTLMLSHPDGRAYAEGALGGMHTGDKLSALSGAERDACFDAFLSGLGSCYDGQAIRFPHVSHVVTARG